MTDKEFKEAIEKALSTLPHWVIEQEVRHAKEKLLLKLRNAIDHELEGLKDKESNHENS